MKNIVYILIILMFLFLFPNICSVYALDELFLTGRVKNIHSNSGVVIVDVKSESCLGVRSFRIDDVSELEGLMGKNISFFIDSSICKRYKSYKMHKVTLLKLRGKRP